MTSDTRACREVAHSRLHLAFVEAAHAPGCLDALSDFEAQIARATGTKVPVILHACGSSGVQLDDVASRG